MSLKERFVCLCIPRFPIEAQRRAEPEFQGVPLILTAPGQVASPESPIAALSVEAARRGAQLSMTVGQALARNSDLVVRALDPAVLSAAREALFEALLGIAPHVELPELSVQATQFLFLETSGLDRFFDSPGGLAAALLSRVERVGFLPAIGIADRRETAQVAAERGEARFGEATLVPVGGDRAWLAPLPLECLRPPGELAAWLAEVGIREIGQLAKISRDEVATRLGRSGVALWEVARGERCRSFNPRIVRDELVEGVSLEWGAESLEALLFILRGILDRLLVRLRLRALSAAGMELRMILVSGHREAREIGVLAPTRDGKTLLRLLRAVLEGSPPGAAVEEMTLVIRPGRVRTEQLDLFRPAGPPPALLAGTLARLAAICGEGRVGRPVVAAGHRPEAASLARFSPSAAPGVSPSDKPGPAFPALYTLRPPRPAQVELRAGLPIFLRAGNIEGDIASSAGPWRIETEWWREAPCRRDYFDVHLHAGGLYRIYRRLDVLWEGKSWFLDAIYD